MKNVISKSFEIQDYMLDNARINGFWMTLEDLENLTTEVVYVPSDTQKFTPTVTEELIRSIIAKCDRFKSLLPVNINCEVTFKDIASLTYTAKGNIPAIKATEMDEIRVSYRFFVEYHI